MKVSAIITYHDEALYIREAIESVLNQTYDDVELIVVDDGSENGIDHIVKSYQQPIHYIYQRNQGLGVARNTGASASTGEYIAFLDADDYWPADRLERQLNAFLTEPGVDIVAGYVKQFISPELDEPARQRLYCPEEPMRGPVPVAMLIRRQAFFQVGFYTADLAINQTLDWLSRAHDEGVEVVVIPDVVLFRRLHKANQSLKKLHGRVDLVRAVKTMLDRRREGVGLGGSDDPSE